MHHVWFAHQMRELGSCLCGVVACLCCLGPVSLIIAIVFFVGAARNHREDLVESYNGVVDIWKHGLAAQFGAISPFLAQATDVGISRRVAVNYTSQPPPRIDSGSDLDKYSQHPIFYGVGRLFNDVHGAYNWPIDDSHYVPSAIQIPSFRVFQQNSQSTVLPYTGEHPSGGAPVVFMAKEFGASQSSCMSRRGIFVGSPSYMDDDDFSTRDDDYHRYDDDDDFNHHHHHHKTVKGVCITFWALRSVCVTVTVPSTTTHRMPLAVRNGTGAAAVDRSWHNEAGCEGIPQALRAATVPSELRFGSAAPFGVSSFGYEQVPAQGRRGPSVVSLSSTRVTVRSGGDPYVEAVRLTNGKPTSFGLTRATQFAIAVAFFVIGGIGCAIPIGILCWVRACVGGGSSSSSSSGGSAGGPWEGQQPQGGGATAPLVQGGGGRDAGGWQPQDPWQPPASAPPPEAVYGGPPQGPVQPYPGQAYPNQPQMQRPGFIVQ